MWQYLFNRRSVRESAEYLVIQEVKQRTFNNLIYLIVHMTEYKQTSKTRVMEEFRLKVNNVVCQTILK